jgi:hypothetical protein
VRQPYGIILAMKLAALAVVFFANGFAESVTPVEKVIALLKGMQTKLEEESSAEATTYDAFACFCKESSTTRSASIAAGEESINLISAELVEKTAQQAEDKTSLLKAKAKREELTADLKATEVRCEKEAADYQAKDADLVKAIDSINNAIQSMESSKPAAAAAGLLIVRKTIEKNPAFDAAMKMMDAGPKWTHFLQTRANVDPLSPEYKYHSQGIIEILQKLGVDFNKEKEDADAEYAKAKQACDDTKEDLQSQLDSNAEEISGLETSIDELTERLAAARVELVQENDMMKLDKLYLTDLTQLCETRANQWDQRSTMRAKELTALTEALDVLEGGVQPKDKVNKRALLQAQHQVGKQETAAARGTVKHRLALIQRSDERVVVEVQAHSQDEQHRDGALTYLRHEGQRLNSGVLTSLVARAGSDPFGKVKTLIQRLVERLIAEATAEATKKGFCDTELGKARTDRANRLAEVKKLSAEIGGLEAKKDALNLEIGELSETLETLKTDAEQAEGVRKGEKEENANALTDARAGLEAVTEAIAILKTFYKEAAKAASLVQVRASPVDEDNPGAGFDGHYKGNQAESKGVIGLLEVIKSDFERTIQMTEDTEKKQAADYVLFDRTSKSDIGSKSTKKELDEQDLKTNKITLEAKYNDLQKNQDLLDDALQEIESLKPQCIDNVMSYEDRVKKRDDEIAALKNALCILDTDGVETENC